jgi:YesN/AraC family two-component response regulator
MPTVLVIDENRATLDTIGRALREAGFSVALASTGGEGLKLAERRPIDLVVADLRLPDITGIEVLRRLRRTFADIPVIVTGLASTASAIEAGKLGAAGYIEKPVLTDQLVQIVRSYVPSPAPAEWGDHARTNPQVIRAMRLIESRFVEPELHVGAVAHELGVSTSHLCRMLKRDTGLTFVMLLRRARVRHACRLLETTPLSMKEIASQTGFSSPSRFDRDFKTIFGVSPSAYRTDVWRHSVTAS